jgi:hypothetical protein
MSMAKKEIVDYVIRAGTLVIMAYAGWNMKKVESLEAKDIVHDARISVVDHGLVTMAGNVHDATEAIEDLTEVVTGMANRQRDILMFVGYRADPWSGDMQIELQMWWFNALKELHPDLELSDIPDVRKIQAKHTDKLIPSGLFEMEK